MSEAAKTSPPSKPQQLAVVTPDRQLGIARFSPDGQMLVAGGCDATVRRWDVGEKQLNPLPHATGHHGWVDTLAFHPKEKWLYTADSWGQLRCSEFDGAEPKVLWKNEQAHDGWIRQIAVSPDGQHLASCGRDRTVRLWSAQGQLVATHRHDEDVYVMTFAPEGQTVVFGDLRGRIRVFDFADEKAVRDFDGKAFYKLDYIQDIAGLRVLMFLDGGKTLAAAGTSPKNGATIQSVPLMLFFDFATGKLEREFRHGAPKDGFINDMALHPDGYLLLVTSGDPGNGKLQFLRPTESEPFYTNTEMANCHSVALHPDGKRFVVSATNRNSNGNGRPNNKDGQYPGNHSPIHFFELPA